MPLRELQAQLKTGLLPVYSVIGDEGLLVDRAEEIIRGIALAPGLEVFNLAVFRGDDDKVDEALSIARTLPMMAKIRVVVIRRVEALKPSLLEQILEFSMGNIDSCCLILTGRKWPAPSGGADFGKRLENRLKKTGGAFRFKSKDQNPAAFLIDTARAEGFEISQRDAQFLVLRVGDDLARLKLELRKAMDWLGKEGQLTAEIFQEACSLLSEAEIWDLTDAILERKVDKALATTHRLLEAGEAPHRLASMIAWQLRQLLVLQSVLRRGDDPRKAGLRMHPNKARAAESALRRNPLNTVQVLETLAAANEKMNSSRVGDRRVLEGLVLNLLSNSA
jgi:DNA polymerase III subunit delta